MGMNAGVVCHGPGRNGDAMRTILSLAVLGVLASGGLAQEGFAGAGIPFLPVTGNQWNGLLPISGVSSQTLEPPEAIPNDALQTDESGGLPTGQFWLRGEYLLWWTKGSQLPPLITSGLPGVSPLPGALGQTGTSVIYGNSDVNHGHRSGGRFTGGFWLDPCGTYGLEASYFFLGSRQTAFNTSSDSLVGSSFIARPFFDALAGTQNAQLVAFPALANGTNILTASGMGIASGDISASTYNRFQGADVNGICGVCSGCNYWLLALVGFRYLELEEGIAITENTSVNPVLPAGRPFFGGSIISISDQFDTRNNFYGGQVGFRGSVRRGRAFVEAQGKIALGVTNQVVDIRGSTSIASPGAAATVTPVGFLASGSNSGHFVRDRFAVVPEIGINAGYQFTDCLSVFVGYNFLYWSSVVRPADQIDLGLSGTQLPTDSRYNPAAGPARPAMHIRDSAFWAQGISFGLGLGF